MHLESRITAGENKGRTLRHDFVALALDGHWQTRLPEAHYRGTGPRALAVRVTGAGGLKSLQAVGGYLEPVSALPWPSKRTFRKLPNRT
jgi:hypothetical protein